MSFINNGIPIGYGAIMYNGSASGMAHSYPFFTSQPNISALPGVDMNGNATTINMENVDDYWLVMPGYKLELYNYPGFGEPLITTSNNTTGTTPVNFVLSPNYNMVSSFKLSYKNSPLYNTIQTSFSLSEQIIGFDGSSSITLRNYSAVTDISYNSSTYRLFSFYTGTTGFVNVVGNVVVNDQPLKIKALLIGGGGSGGHATSVAAEGAGGAGAGTFVTTDIAMIDNLTFMITVGNGGTGIPSGIVEGNYGQVSSIVGHVGSTQVALIAGGGGGGGAGDRPAGYNDALYGSTGGAMGYAGYHAATTVLTTPYILKNSDEIFSNISANVNAGGDGPNLKGGGGGGGAGGAGGAGGTTVNTNGGTGGNGQLWSINGTTYAGGGGGGNSRTYAGANGGSGVGGHGNGGSGQSNTGSGGGAGYEGTPSGAGGSGICIIAVPIIT